MELLRAKIAGLPREVKLEAEGAALAQRDLGLDKPPEMVVPEPSDDVDLHEPDMTGWEELIGGGS